MDRRILECNKLIANFMGYEYIPYNSELVTRELPGWRKKDSVIFSPKQIGYLGRNHYCLKYHSSWNWIMEVVERIENLDIKNYCYQWLGNDNTTEYNFINFDVDITSHECFIWLNWTLDPASLINKSTSERKIFKDDKTSSKKLQLVYDSIVEFIFWYNEFLTKIEKEE